MEKLVITVYINKDTNIDDLGKQTNEYGGYLESCGLEPIYETDNEELKGIIPKPKKIG